jgi:hypothetical protein
MKKEYGPGKDFCVGAFLPDHRWVDFCSHWSVVGPKLRHFQYADTKKDAALLLEDFHVRVGTKVRSGLAGFDYDGSSKTWVVWSLLGHPYDVDGLIQFTVHDFDYAANLVPREEADWTMLEGLQAFGKNCWANRNAVWKAVDVGGRFIYPKTQQELDTYRNHVMITDLSVTGGKCLDERLCGSGQRISIRPEIQLDDEVGYSFSRLWTNTKDEETAKELEGLLT